MGDEPPHLTPRLDGACEQRVGEAGVTHVIDDNLDPHGRLDRVRLTCNV